MRTDPRIRQTWNQISHNLESANEQAQVNLFTFSQRYIGPCLASIGSCVQSTTAPCFYSREERLRRSRGRGGGAGGGGGRTGRIEFGFDFYDDWENDDYAADALLNLGNDELDRLLAGPGTRGATVGQPGRPRAMSYGARRDRVPRGRRTTTVAGQHQHESGQDPTIIPSTNVFGFFGRLPWQLGAKGLKYTPSTADLQDRSGIVHRSNVVKAEPPLNERDDDHGDADAPRKRQTPHRGRSGTNTSESASDSMRSRADLFPSDDEADAVPLDDEFTIGLERRVTGSGTDQAELGRARGKTSSTSRPSTKTQSSSSKDRRKSEIQPRSGSVSTTNAAATVSSEDELSISNTGDLVEIPTLADLIREEDAVRHQEELAVERKRLAASRLASQRGLSVDGHRNVCCSDGSVSTGSS